MQQLKGWICDFCSSPEVIGGYDTPDFALYEYSWGSEGGFAVCAVCKDLVDRERWKDLLNRSVETYAVGAKPSPAEQVFIRTALRRLHSEFRVLRKRYKPIGEWAA